MPYLRSHRGLMAKPGSKPHSSKPQLCFQDQPACHQCTAEARLAEEPPGPRLSMKGSYVNTMGGPSSEMRIYWTSAAVFLGKWHLMNKRPTIRTAGSVGHGLEQSKEKQDCLSALKINPCLLVPNPTLMFWEGNLHACAAFGGKELR